MTNRAAQQDYKKAVEEAKQLFLEECKPVDARFLERLKKARQAYVKAGGE